MSRLVAEQGDGDDLVVLDGFEVLDGGEDGLAVDVGAGTQKRWTTPQPTVGSSGSGMADRG